VISITSRKLRVLEVAILRVHHLDEKDWVSLSWNSCQSDVKVGSHINNQESVILVISVVGKSNLVNSKLEKLEAMVCFSSVRWWLTEKIHVIDVFSL
jgi:hypothetical protein